MSLIFRNRIKINNHTTLAFYDDDNIEIIETLKNYNSSTKSWQKTETIKFLNELELSELKNSNKNVNRSISLNLPKGHIDIININLSPLQSQSSSTGTGDIHLSNQPYHENEAIFYNKTFGRLLKEKLHERFGLHKLCFEKNHPSGENNGAHNESEYLQIFLMLKISVALAIAVILCFLFYWTYYFCKTQSRSKALNRKASRTKIREPDENINAGNFRKNGNKNLLLPPNFHRSLSSLHRISSSRSSRCRGKSRLQVDIKNVSKMNSSSSENLYGFSSLNDDQRAKSWLTLYNSSKSNKESTEGAS